MFTDEELDRLAAPHVARAMFLEIDLPSGVQYLHNGVGRKTIGGQEWRGVTDPINAQAVQIPGVDEPRFGQAPAVQIVLSGARVEFFQSVKNMARELEGRTANLYWAAFDAETGETLIGLKRLFPGRITAPKLMASGIGTRTIVLTLESIWASQNFPFWGKWTDADQKRRYPGDKGMQFVGVPVQERWE